MGSVSRFSRRYRSRSEVAPQTGASPFFRATVAATEDEFLALRDTWHDIQAQSRCDSAINDWDWVRFWWEIFAKGEERATPYVVTVLDGDKPVAIFPFFENAQTSGVLAPRRLRQMGYGGELDPASLTEEPLAVVAAGYELTTAQFITTELARELRRGRWDCLSFRSVASQRLESESGLRHGVAFVAKSKQGSRVAPLPATWSALRSGLSKSMRDNLGYYPRLLTREGHAFEIKVYHDVEGVREAVDDLVELHRTRARADESGKRDDHIPTELQAGMLRVSLPEMAREGRAFIAILEVDGVVVAAQAFLRSGRQLLVHYSGFDPAYGRYSPLLVLQSEVLRWAIENGLSEMNVLLGNAAWQKRWNAEPATYTRQCRMASLWPMSLVRCAAYALRREFASRDRRTKFGLCIIWIQRGVSGAHASLYQAHLALSRFSATPVAHHMMRVHR